MRAVDCPECFEPIGAGTEAELLVAVRRHLADQHQREDADEGLRSYVLQYSKDTSSAVDLAFRAGCGLALYSAAAFPLSLIGSDSPVASFFGVTAVSALALAVLCLLVVAREAALRA